MSNIKGLENFKSSGPRMPFVKILNGKGALEAGLPEGTLIDSVTGVQLAAPGEKFKFVPVFYYEDWSIWEDSKLIKKSVSKTGVWSDGTEIFAEEVEWQKDGDKNIPPIASHAVNLVILPVAEFKSKEENKRYLILSFLGGNEFKAQAQKDLIALITKKIEALELGALYGAAYSISTKEVQNKKKKKWFEYCSPEFVKVVAEKSLKIAETVYETVKAVYEVDFQKTLAAPAGQKAIAAKSEAVDAEVVEEEDKPVPAKAKAKAAVKAEAVEAEVEVDEDADF